MTTHLVAHLSKLIPTDMNWAGNFANATCQVRLSHRDDPNAKWVVAVNGNDDTCLVLPLDTYEEAISVYNRLNYVQSDKDLTMFMNEESYNNYSNGWPSERHMNHEIWEHG
jgi:hypothetical protein